MVFPNTLNLTDTFILRAQLLKEIRHFFEQHNFLEVETPLRIPQNAPERHIDPVLSEDWFLQTSPELCMKRILAQGYNRIFQLCKCFRQEERGKQHLPEFTMLEWYETHISTTELMQTTENLIRHLCQHLLDQSTLSYQGYLIDMASPFKYYTVQELFNLFSPISYEKALATNQFDEIIGTTIAPQLGFDQPVFIDKYPITQSVLATTDSSNPSLANRFELYIAGMEICNGCEELTDKSIQKDRFFLENQVREKMNKHISSLPSAFLMEMNHLPPCAGNALGIDRLCMLFTNAPNIENTVFFPPEKLILF